jgi:hypothetical protein
VHRHRHGRHRHLGEPEVPSITSAADAREIARAGHRVFRRLKDAAIPTFAFVNGAAMGGGLEAVQDVDLCMLLGAGWPFWLGGISAHLDRVGVSGAVRGARFLPPGVASLPACPPPSWDQVTRPPGHLPHGRTPGRSLFDRVT